MIHHDFTFFSNSTVQERSKIVELYKTQNIFPNIVFLWLLCAQQKMVISQQFKNPHTNTPWYLSQSECVELFYKKLHPTNSLNLVVQVSRIELVIFSSFGWPISEISIIGLADLVDLVAKVLPSTLLSQTTSESCVILNSITVHRLMKCQWMVCVFFQVKRFYIRRALHFYVFHSI